MHNNRLINLREQLKLSRYEIAEMLNISEKEYTRYEKGSNNIPIEILCKLADFYGTSIDYILYNTDEYIPHN